jgi:hypothetical protein
MLALLELGPRLHDWSQRRQAAQRGSGARRVADVEAYRAQRRAHLDAILKAEPPSRVDVAGRRQGASVERDWQTRR